MAIPPVVEDEDSSLAGQGVSAATSATTTATPATDQAAGGASSLLGEVVVTATRREEALQKVPVSITAFTQTQLDVTGQRNIEDIARYTPGLTFTVTDFTGGNQISIRGISSSAGAGTTGIYIDDTPIQVRYLGYGSGTAFPGLFDISRVEVLRGPQGTLFGAGSEGGTVRFITPEPSLTAYSNYDRAEISYTKNGAPNYEVGAAFGGPLIPDVIGIRVSAYWRYDGGFIDAVNGNYKIVDPTGNSYGNAVAFTPTSTYENHINWGRTTGARAELRIAAGEAVTIEPSFFYQKRYDNDGAGTTFWLPQSNVSNAQYARPFYFAGDPAKDPTLSPIDVPNNQWGSDYFTLTGLRIQANLGPVQLISNTSYFDRSDTQWADFTTGYLDFYRLAEFPNGAFPPYGWKGMDPYLDNQANFVEEIRLQNSDTASRVNWVAGFFYAHDRQSAGEPISVNFLAHAAEISLCGVCGVGLPGGAPYGPGSTAYENYLGVDLGPNDVTFNESFRSIDQQLAVFGQADIDITSKLKLTAGLRFAKLKLDFAAAYWAGDNNANAPFGFLIPGTTVGEYGVGQGPYAPVYPASTASASNTATTPKIGLSFQLDEHNMVYGTASKGYRQEGANLAVPAVCDFDLVTFGYFGGGKSTEPSTYQPDSVWSYELGSKNRLFDGHLVLDSSVFLIKWKNIQTSVFLPDCAYSFVDNLANATSKGFDFAFQAGPWAGFFFSGSVGYVDATFDSAAKSPSGVVIYQGGSAIPSAGPPWTITASPEYDFQLFKQQNFYTRADFTWTSHERPTGNELYGDPQYDPYTYPNPSYGLLNLRLGWRLGGSDLSLFVNNVNDAHPILNINRSLFYSPYLWLGSAIRPRTYGVTYFAHF